MKCSCVRIMNERSPAALHMTAGVIEVSDDAARILQLLVHSRTGELAASFQTVVAHVTVNERRPFPWSARALPNATRSRTRARMASSARSATPMRRMQ